MAEGKLEQAVTDCHALISEYQSTDASALDLAAVLRLLAKVIKSAPIALDSAQSSCHWGRICTVRFTIDVQHSGRKDKAIKSAPISTDCILH